MNTVRNEQTDKIVSSVMDVLDCNKFGLETLSGPCRIVYTIDYLLSPNLSDIVKTLSDGSEVNVDLDGAIWRRVLVSLKEDRGTYVFLNPLFDQLYDHVNKKHNPKK